MKKREPSNERGQVLVLLVLGFVVLLGFTALAIDGGMLYSDRRHAQSATDAASLAGGGAAAQKLTNSSVNYLYWACSDSVIQQAQQLAENAAIARAASNDYTIDDDISDKHGVTTICDTEDHIGWTEKFIDVETWITRDTSTAFAHLLYSGPLRGTVEAVTRVHPTTPLGFGHAIVSLNEDACQGNQNGVILGGSNISLIDGGGIFSNGCLSCNGTAFHVDVDNFDDDIIGMGYAGDSNCDPTQHDLDPDPIAAPSKLPDYVTDVPAVPDCTGLPNQGSSNGDGEIDPGIYSQIRLNSGDLIMNPGVYCVTGSPNAIAFNGGTVTGNDVNFYVESGDVTISGNASVKLSAPANMPVLFYLPSSNTSGFELVGNDETEFFGIIFAPGADVKITGANNTNPTLNTQIIGYNVEISGNADLDINFTGSDTFQVPASMELYK